MHFLEKPTLHGCCVAWWLLRPTFFISKASLPGPTLLYPSMMIEDLQDGVGYQSQTEQCRCVCVCSVPYYFLDPPYSSWRWFESETCKIIIHSVPISLILVQTSRTFGDGGWTGPFKSLPFDGLAPMKHAWVSVKTCSCVCMFFRSPKWSNALFSAKDHKSGIS